MFGRFATAAFCFFIFLGCAEPKYVRVSADGSGTNTQEQAASNCPVRWSTSNNCLTWMWETKPTSSTPGSLIFKISRPNLFDGSHVVIDPTVTPGLLLWMDSMGHGSAPVQVNRLDVGTFRASNVFFVMPGDWSLKFQLKEGDRIQDEAVVSVTF